MTTTTKKTMTPAQMAWSLKKGFAWPEPRHEDDDGYASLGDVFWTRQGGYMWNVDLQMFEMVF